MNHPVLSAYSAIDAAFDEIADQTCTTTGCTMPAAFCEATTRPWSKGGKTSFTRRQ